MWFGWTQFHLLLEATDFECHVPWRKGLELSNTTICVLWCPPVHSDMHLRASFPHRVTQSWMVIKLCLTWEYHKISCVHIIICMSTSPLPLLNFALHCVQCFLVSQFHSYWVYFLTWHIYFFFNIIIHWVSKWYKHLVIFLYYGKNSGIIIRKRYSRDNNYSLT